VKDALKVTRKEVREMLRDKRVRNAALVAPMFITFLMLFLFGFLGETIGKSENQRIHIVRTDNPIVDQLKKDKFNVIFIDSLADGQKLIRDGKASAVLDFDKDFGVDLAAHKQAHVSMYFDDKESKAQIAVAAVSKEVATYNAEKLVAVFAAKQITKDMSEPIALESKPVQLGKSDVSGILISILPYIITVYAFFGGLATGSELVAGEKEKNTLETLLITPLNRRDIAMGKFFALCAVCISGSLSALLGVIIAGSSGLPIFHTVFPHGLGIGASQIGAIIVTLVPTVAFFASLLLAVSTMAKNTREAQQFLALVNLVVLMPAIFSQFLGFTDLASARWIDFVPVLNTSVILRQALQGKIDGLGMLITLGVSAVLATIGIRIAIHLFNREQVLVRV
jgi:sodium transport system permease protein